MNKTTLSTQEKNWILEQRVTRLSDQKETLIYPMGAERYLSAVLSGRQKNRYQILANIKDKDVLVIPGYGNSAFLFAQFGAKSVTVYDKDPVTIAWIKAFKAFFHYRGTDPSCPSIGELLTALTCWYPPLLKLPSGRLMNRVHWIMNPKFLRRSYIFYMMSLVQQAIQLNIGCQYELEKNIRFFAGEVEQVKTDTKKTFDTIFVPYLLGVRHGIEQEKEIVFFIKQLTKLAPEGRILVTPTRNCKEFHVAGQRYFTTTPYSSIQAIPELTTYEIEYDKHWFRTQGLTVFVSEKPRSSGIMGI